jgi:hypothetical protein
MRRIVMPVGTGGMVYSGVIVTVVEQPIGRLVDKIEVGFSFTGKYGVDPVYAYKPSSINQNKSSMSHSHCIVGMYV